MNVLVLGGTGRTGRQVAEILAASDLVGDIAIASRDQAAAARAASALGPKARGVQLNIGDEDALPALVAPYDLVVNLAGPYYQVMLPAIRAAIRAGTAYCDISEDARTTREALTLDPDARAVGIPVLISIGGSPGLTNLLAKYAWAQLDGVDELHCCVLFDSRRLANYQNASMHSILEAASGLIPTYQAGVWVEIEASSHGVDVAIPGRPTVRAYPSGMAEPVTLPRYLPGVNTVSSLYGFLSPRVSELFHAQVRRITAGELDAWQAVASFYDALACEPGEAPASQEGATWFGVIAQGRLAGRRVRTTLTLAAGSTPATLAAAALKLLRGEIRECGVLPPEACLDPVRFLDEMVGLLPQDQRPPAENIVVETRHWLD